MTFKAPMSDSAPPSYYIIKGFVAVHDWCLGTPPSWTTSPSMLLLLLGTIFRSTLSQDALKNTLYDRMTFMCHLFTMSLLIVILLKHPKTPIAEVGAWPKIWTCNKWWPWAREYRDWVRHQVGTNQTNQQQAAEHEGPHDSQAFALNVRPWVRLSLDNMKLLTGRCLECWESTLGSVSLTFNIPPFYAVWAYIVIICIVIVGTWWYT